MKDDIPMRYLGLANGWAAVPAEVAACAAKNHVVKESAPEQFRDRQIYCTKCRIRYSVDSSG